MDYYRVKLPLATITPYEHAGDDINDPNRVLYINPAVDTVAVLGDLDYSRISQLLKGLRVSDPEGNGLQKFAVSASWTYHQGAGDTIRMLAKHMFPELEEMTVFMYDEKMPPSDWTGGTYTTLAILFLDWDCLQLVLLEALFELVCASWISVDQDPVHFGLITVDGVENFAVNEGAEILRGQETLIVKLALNLCGKFGGAIDTHPSAQAITDRVVHELNIAGGEPFLYPRLLTELLQFGKEELGLESISIVSNGSKITEKWMRENCQWLDILAISCDSFNPETNKKIGRGDDGGNVIRLFRIAEWCRDYGIKFKLNTVVNIHNWNEDMSAEIERLEPFRWKVFQCLIVAGENENATRLRDATTFLVTDEQWKTFCGRHKHLPCYVPEDTNAMASSYLLLDEYLCFLDKGEGMITKSESILKVGVEKAMTQVVWDKGSFLDRGGIYDWGRSDMAKEGDCGGGSNEKLQW
ncbi:radical s-adenosyl methionine domain-containing protein [Fusarium phyllophilum]|uniref:Radical s-adenosyl methionine domain-containing protein n=1 Tax=Fusarium phyllophilum TaxID=47803 RepID=A0A8H5JZG0_9HYPO|nr:radical s-adenosyl methionine domain-containing protein [Fusarium phyllophilum]